MARRGGGRRASRTAIFTSPFPLVVATDHSIPSSRAASAALSPPTQIKSVKSPKTALSGLEFFSLLPVWLTCRPQTLGIPVRDSRIRTGHSSHRTENHYGQSWKPTGNRCSLFDHGGSNPIGCPTGWHRIDRDCWGKRCSLPYLATADPQTCHQTYYML